jgi:hypothetical protein
MSAADDTSEIDFYEVLGVQRGATDAQLKSAYRKLARIHHPDANSSPDTTRFKQITHAYSVLSNPERRSEYDQTGALFLPSTATWDEPFDLPFVSMEEMLPDAANAPTEEVGWAAPRNWDFLLSTFLIVILVAQTALFVVLGLSFGIQVFSCADQPGVCNIPVINWSARVLIFGTPLIALAAIIFAIVRLVRRKQAWWIPLAGMVLNFGVYLVATWLVDQSVPG